MHPILDNLPDRAWHKDAEGRFVYVNSAFARDVGRTVEQIIGTTDFENWPAEQASRFRKDDMEVMTSRQARAFEQRVVDALGTNWYETYKAPLFGDDGSVVGTIGMARNITERKAMQQEISDVNERLTKITQMVPGMLFQFVRTAEGASRFPFVSRDLFEVHGVNGEDVRHDASRIFAIVHKEDRERLVASIHESALHLTLWDTQYRIPARDGSIRWMQGLARPERLPDGSTIWNGYIIDITERKRADLDMLRLSVVADSTAYGVVIVDTDARVQWVNRGFTRQTGYSLEEILGKRPRDFLWGPGSAESAKRQVDIGLESGQAFELEILCYRKDGSTFWRHSKHDPIVDTNGILTGFVIVHSDVTQRREAEQRARENEARYQEMFFHSPQPMWVYDTQTLRYIAVNDAALKHYGYSRREFLGMRLQDLRLPEEVPALLDALNEDDRSIRTWKRPWRHRRKDGSLIDVEIASHTLVFEGRNAALVMITDVTDRLKTEQAMRELNATLEQRVAERTQLLTEAVKELEKFSYTVAHDLKAPLRHIDAFSQLLLEDYGDRLDDEGRQLLGRIRAGAAQMNTLVEDLLTYARIERRELALAAIELGPLISRLVQEMGNEIKRTGAAVVLPPNEARVRADPAGLALILRNLLDNALKFSRPDVPPRVEISAARHGDVVRIAVADNGVGFDMAYHDRIFEIFQRLHRAEEYPGTGIGLANAAKAAQRMNGRMWAESVPGKGATFYVELPAA